MTVIKKRFLVLLALIITILPLAVIFSPIILNYGKTGKNTYILDKNYSYLEKNDILSQLDKDFQLPSVVRLVGVQKEYSLNLASVSASLNKDRIASTILYRRLNQGIPAYIKYFFAPKKFSLEINYDKQALGGFSSDLASQLNKPYIPSSFQLKSKSLVYSQGEQGVDLDIAALEQDLLENLSLGKFNDPISLKFNTTGTIPSERQVEAAKIRANKLIGKSLTLKTDSNTISLDDKTMISWLDFNNSFNQTAIEEYVKTVSQSLRQEPVNALFKFENNKVLEFRPAINGIEPLETEMVTTIKQSIDQLVDSNQSVVTASIPVKTMEPSLKTEDANNLGIKELLGRGVSSFKHSDSIRNFNIEKGASIVNRILVAPGDTFSFVKSLGEVTLDNGFKKAYIIRQGRTELDVGGGICQVSTTLFRAMLNSGLDITERRAHAYRVSYYEEDSPPGFDATVFIPSPDLKFTNDTGHYLLIQSIYDGASKVLTYEIYGTSDGRKAEISNYRKWDATPAPPDRFIDDPTLPPGKVIQEEHRVPGIKTAFDWKVTKDGQIIHQKTFQSNYVPWAAVYRRGI